MDENAPALEPRLAIGLAGVIDVARGVRGVRAVDRPLAVNLEQVPGLQRVGVARGNPRPRILGDEIPFAQFGSGKEPMPETGPRLSDCNLRIYRFHMTSV